MCTEEDLAKFAPPTFDSEKVLNKIMSNPKRGLYCFDWERDGENLEIWGVSQYDDFRYVDIALLPCQYNHTFTGRNDSVIAEECVWDR